MRDAGCRHRYSYESGNPHPTPPLRRDMPGFWIPACAGMTVEAGCGIPIRYPYAPTPPSFPRKQESTPTIPLRRDIPGFWIPACAGMTVRADAGCRHRYSYTPTPPSFPRKRESTLALPIRRDMPGFWIPAYAGMTVGGRMRDADTPSLRPARPVIPAKAGIHPRPTATPGYTGVLDSGLRRNDGGCGCGMPIRYPYAPPGPSFPRKRESTPALPLRRDIPGFWIPAYAGMTVGGGCGMPIPLFRRPNPTIIPAPTPSFPRKRESTLALWIPGLSPGIRPPPSFRCRPESRTPVCPQLRKGRGVDSRFRGNDGGGRNSGMG